MKLIHLLSLHIFAPLFFLCGQKIQDDTYAFSDKVSSLKLKSAAHEKEIAKLLSSTVLHPTNFVVPSPESIQPVLPTAGSQPEVPPAPYLPVPDYYEVVKDPTDIESVSERLESENYYVTLEMFAADFKRMFENCRLYNAADTIYYKCANRLELFFDAKIAAGITFKVREAGSYLNR